VPTATLENVIVLELEVCVCPATVTVHVVPEGNPLSVKVTLQVEAAKVTVTGIEL
jgi:hypothetical protein